MTHGHTLSRRLAAAHHYPMLVLLALAAACAAGEPTGTSSLPTQPTNDIATIAVAPKAATTDIDEPVQLHATLSTPAGDSTGITVDWTTSGGTVSSTGLFLSKSTGTFRVVGKARGHTKSDTSVVVVVPPASAVTAVTVTPASATLAPAATLSFVAQARLSDGSTAPAPVRWSATGGSIDSLGGYTAGTTAGSYRVIAATSTGIADTSVVTITAPVSTPTLTKVILAPSSASVPTGGTKQFSASGTMSDGTTAAVAVRYSATGGSISAAGLYTGGTAAGSFAVIATDSASGKADTSAVNVTPVVASVVVSPSSATVQAGATTQLSAAVRDASGTAMSGQTVTWSSSNTAVATVTSNGVVSGIAAGSATITALSSGKQGTASLTVTAPPPPSGGSCPASGYARRVSVSTLSQLTSALSNAQPGDQIELADGSYNGSGVTATRSGTASAPITLCGSRSAVIDGGNYYTSTVFLNGASYWTLKGFTVTRGMYGVLIEHGSHNVVDGLAISNIGQEAVMIRLYSSANTLRNSGIHDTGKTTAEYGEGVYIGSANNHWCTYTNCQPDTSDQNQVLNNTIGPNVTAEMVDIKEGTTGGVIDGNVFDGRGQVMSQPWVNSWLEAKGNSYQITNNRGSVALQIGFKAIEVLSGWGRSNVFDHNTADLQGASGVGFWLSSGLGNVVRCTNTVVNAGGGFSNVACQ